MNVKCFTITAMLAAQFAVHAQSNKPATSSNRKDYLSPEKIAPQSRELAEALGDRIKQPGKERLVTVGNLMISGASTPVRITTEIPDKFRIDYLGTSQKSIAAGDQDAKSDKGEVTDLENDQIESIFFDAQDYFLFQSENGQAMRLLGRRFRPDDSKTMPYTGPTFDIYELSQRETKRSDKAKRQKHFYFDSQSSLLQMVRYKVSKGGRTVLVQTELKDWKLEGGVKIPKQIIRKEDGVEVFRLDMTSASAVSKAADSQFLIP